VAARIRSLHTTKDVGQGTGVGLDIVRRIVVERHGGKISIDSRPGETTFRIEVPVHRSEQG
jgi:signal transduction histidine kinase